MKLKQKCAYCDGHTIDDERGNCGACGAPREKPQYLDPQHEWIDITAKDIRKTIKGLSFIGAGI